ncbi:MAG: sigma-70 family RNA polymerase sigma factor [Filimonas sp.]|nr:sigma-70 family RNA polymerase sigma factor [Filimonas sp.]
MASSLSSCTDQDLLVQLRQDDRQAFIAIYDRHWAGLLQYVIGIVKNLPDAEDILQELFTSIWRRRTELQIEQSLATYLYAAAKYLSIRYVEKNMDRYAKLSSLVTPSFHNETGEQALTLKEIQFQTEQVVSAMPARMRQAFTLSRNSHLSYKEIAKQMNVSEETVKKQIKRALRILRARLGDRVFLLALLTSPQLLYFFSAAVPLPSFQ